MSRTRSQLSDPVVSAFSDHFVREKWQGTWYNPNRILLSGNFISQDSKTMTDDVRPGYFRAQREGKPLPVGPMSSVKIERFSVPGSASGLAAYKTSARSDGYSFSGDGDWAFNGPFAPVPGYTAPNKAVLLQEALSRAQTDAWDTLTFAAEFRKTVEGVVSLRTRAETLFDRFSSIVSHRRRSKKWKGVALSELVAEVWLELRYMWRPLVYDMYSMEEAYARMAEDRVGALHRAYASSETTSSQTSTFTGAWQGPHGTGGGGAFQRFVASTTTRTIRAHASVGLTIRTRAVTMTDPLVTAWELIPFSFVLDWFVTFGSMLSAFSPFASGEVQFATFSVEDQVIERAQAVPVNSATYPIMDGSPVPSIHQRTTTNYTRTVEVVTPTLSIDINLNAAKVLDLVALWLTRNAKLIKRLAL